MNNSNKEHNEKVIQDAEESRRFWSDIWDQVLTHREKRLQIG